MFNNLWLNEKRLIVSYILFILLILIYIGNINQYDFVNGKQERILAGSYKTLLVTEKQMDFEEHEESYGEMGKPVLVLQNWTRTLNKSIENCEEEYGYNDCISNLVSLDRTLPDFRNEKCMEVYNDDDVYPFGNDFLDYSFTAVSVVIIFYNEAWTTLLRTIHSVINRSSHFLLSEIVLVDNASTKFHLKSQLNTYLKRNLFKGVRFFRTYRRLGVMKARIFAAEKSIGNILIFLDPCCEVTKGWLQPLVSRLTASKNIIAIPVIDKINKTTFEYQPQNLSNLLVSGFDWNLQLIRDRIIRKSDGITPFIIPVISYGIFAVTEKYFFEIINDRYDFLFSPEINDLEISFQTWLCGGKIEIVPCSRIGYLYGKKIITSINIGEEENSIRTQKAQIAEVWMDDFKNCYFQQMGNGVIKIGNVIVRKRWKKESDCKSFDWYLNNVYPQLKPIKSNFTGELEYLQHDDKLCLASQTVREDLHERVKLHPCHGNGGNQFWLYSMEGKIRQNDVCLSSDGEINITLVACQDQNNNQVWKYNHDIKQIYHKKSRKCLAVTHEKGLAFENCSDYSNRSWSFNKYSYTILY